MKFNLRAAEWHNAVLRGGKLRSRPRFRTVKSATDGTEYVHGFSVESPSTTEVWHYLFEQATATNVLTLRVFTEDFFEVFSLVIGVVPWMPVITHAVQFNQMLINSPSWSVPLYGPVGGGLVPALKVDSINQDTTALDLPPGLVCVFGDRFVIAANNTLFFSDPGTEPRTFVAQNTVALNGQILDVFQGTDGALYVFTTQDAFFIPQDALGKGQLVDGFVGAIQGINTVQSRNAAPMDSGIAIVQESDIVVLGSAGGRSTINLDKYQGRTKLAIDVSLDDYRPESRVYRAANGVAVAIERLKAFFYVDTREKYAAYFWDTNGTVLRGVLRDRAGADIFLTSAAVQLWEGRAAGNTTPVVFKIRPPIPPMDSPVVRRVRGKSEAVGGTVSIYLAKQTITATVTADALTACLIGTNVWSASLVSLYQREMRNVRLTCKARMTDPQIEWKMTGLDMRIEEVVELEFSGQGTERPDVRR